MILQYLPYALCVILCVIFLSYIVYLLEKTSYTKKDLEAERKDGRYSKEVYEQEIKKLNLEQSVLQTSLMYSEDRYNKLLSQKKSSEVRLGQISEHMAPFTEAWPYDSKNFRFIGSPIDGITFEKDKIVFVEIKTGKSRLSSKQRDIKALVDSGKVEFMTFKVEEDSITVE